MIQEKYVSFEVAKLLKKKGFDEFCHNIYQCDGRFIKVSLLTGCNAEKNSNCITEYAAPTHQMAMAWLREKGIHINVSISYDTSKDADGNEVDRWTFWFFEILSSFSGNLIYVEEVNNFDTYEEAVEEALKYSLENLI